MNARDGWISMPWFSSWGEGRRIQVWYTRYGDIGIPLVANIYILSLLRNALLYMLYFSLPSTWELSLVSVPLRRRPWLAYNSLR